MRNAAISGTQLLRECLAVVTKRLPPGWAAQAEFDPVFRTPTAAFRPDAIIDLKAPDGCSATVIVEAKRTIEPRFIPDIVQQLRRYAEALAATNDRLPRNASDSSVNQQVALLVVASFISSRTRELLKERQCGYADPTGNTWLSISRPGLFIETSGAAKDPNSLERPLQSLKGPATGRTIRALCELKSPFGVRDLATRARLPIATLSRVIDFLVREALIERDRKGTILRVDWEGAIRRWSDDYSFFKSNRVRTFLDARGIATLRQKLIQAPWTYAITGSLAASLIAPVAAPRLAQIYVKDADVTAEALELTPTEAGANTMLAEPFSDMVFERTIAREGLVCAAPAQVAVDLLSSPGRGPTEAEALFAWMRENEDAWRN